MTPREPTYIRNLFGDTGLRCSLAPMRRARGQARPGPGPGAAVINDQVSMKENPSQPKSGPSRWPRMDVTDPEGTFITFSTDAGLLCCGGRGRVSPASAEKVRKVLSGSVPSVRSHRGSPNVAGVAFR